MTQQGTNYHNQAYSQAKLVEAVSWDISIENNKYPVGKQGCWLLFTRKKRWDDFDPHPLVGTYIMCTVVIRSHTSRLGKGLLKAHSMGKSCQYWEAKSPPLDCNSICLTRKLVRTITVQEKSCVPSATLSPLCTVCHTCYYFSGLRAHCLTCSQIDYVIGTHGHSDHIGNLGLFTDATHIVSHDINRGKLYTSHPFNEVSSAERDIML